MVSNGMMSESIFFPGQSQLPYIGAALTAVLFILMFFIGISHVPTGRQVWPIKELEYLGLTKFGESHFLSEPPFLHV